MRDTAARMMAQVMLNDDHSSGLRFALLFICCCCCCLHALLSIIASACARVRVRFCVMIVLRSFEFITRCLRTKAQIHCCCCCFSFFLFRYE